MAYSNVKLEVDHFAALRAWPSTDDVAFQTSGGASENRLFEKVDVRISITI